MKHRSFQPNNNSGRLSLGRPASGGAHIIEFLQTSPSVRLEALAYLSFHVVWNVRKSYTEETNEQQPPPNEPMVIVYRNVSDFYFDFAVVHTVRQVLVDTVFRVGECSDLAEYGDPGPSNPTTREKTSLCGGCS